MIKNQEEIFDDYKWEMSRKHFIRSLFVLGIASQIPFLSGCKTETNDKQEDFNCSPLSKNQLKVVQAVQMILFPKEGNGPSALDVNADKWVVYTLNDVRIPERDNDFFFLHLNTLIELSEEKHSKAFDLLSIEQQHNLIELFFEVDVQKKWGSRMVTFILEALLLDPIYGVNPDEAGWKWLDHNPGVPRPNNQTKYPEIYTTIGDV